MRLPAIWAGASRREENHVRWEDTDPVGAITAKAKEAQKQGITKQNRRTRQTRRQRNNRREY